MISSKDKKLLLVAGGLILLILCYSFFFLPKEQENRNMAADNEARTTKLTTIRTLDGRRKAASKENKALSATNSAILALFPENIDNWQIISDAGSLEGMSGMKLVSLSTGKPALVSDGESEGKSAAELAFEADRDKEEKEKKIASEQGIDIETSESSNYNNKMKLYSIEVTAGISGSESGFRNLLSIMKEGNRRSIKSMDVKSDGHGNVTGSLIYDVYYITGRDAENENNEEQTQAEALP